MNRILLLARKDVSFKKRLYIASEKILYILFIHVNSRSRRW